MRCNHIPERIETELGTLYKCKVCGEDITHLGRRIQNLYIKQRFYQGQGQSYTSWIQGIYNTIQTGGILVLIFGGEKVKMLAIWVFVLAWAIQTIIETWIGRQDYKKWRLAQRQTTLAASFTPATVETLRILNELRDKMAPELKKPSILDQLK
jgi:abortive infection bacteriophage resistance protein